MSTLRPHRPVRSSVFREFLLVVVSVAILTAIGYVQFAQNEARTPSPADRMTAQVRAYHTAIEDLQHRLEATRDSLRVEREADDRGTTPEIVRLTERAADRHDLPRGVMLRLVRVESNYNPRAVSHRAAYGLAQVRVPTARIFEPGVTAERLLADPALNLDLGARYLKRLLRRYDGDLHTALRAYNAGPTRVDRLGRRQILVSRSYADRVLATSAEAR